MNTNQKTCHYCATIYGGESRCPICRRKPLDMSGKHVPTVIVAHRLPIDFFVSKQVTVTIDRGSGNKTSFVGKTVNETNSFYHVQVEPKPEHARIDEWFAKQSKHVHVI